MDQADVSVVSTARRADPGLGAHPRTSESPVDFSSRPPTAGQSEPAPTDFRGYFDFEPDAPVFKVPRLPPLRTYATEMSATWTNVTVSKLVRRHP